MISGPKIEGGDRKVCIHKTRFGGHFAPFYPDFTRNCA